MSLDSKLNIYLSSGGVPRPKSNQLQPPRIGYLRQTKFGEVWVVDWFYEPGQIHGSQEIMKAGSIHALLDLKLGDFNPSLATVIDTETTGLAGGTGTYAFIIGAGFWQDDRFVVRQYMMRDFNEEPAQLLALSEDFTGSVITFNGKCFDIPLLTSRFRLHRFDAIFENAPHLDMLFPSRRLWKRSLTSFKLTHLEEKILGYARVDDIPSYMIPSIFFDYLQNRDETLLYPILNHNRDDILSLYQLTVIATDLLKQCDSAGHNDDDLLLSIAEIYFNNCQFADSLNILERINPNFASEDTLKRANHIKALVYKRQGKWNKAVTAFAELHKLAPEMYSTIELAKLYEHKFKDPQKALEILSQAESYLEFLACLGEGDNRLSEALLHRKNRLRRKINRSLHI